MKNHLNKKAIAQSILSIAVFGIFALLATGSIELLFTKTEYLGDGVYKETEYYDETEREVTTGTRDKNGRWNGPVTIEFSDDDDFSYRKEVVNMVHGKRHGTSLVTFRDFLIKEEVYSNCYNMGKRINCQKSAQKNTVVTTSFQLLSYEYPWFLFTLYTSGFADEYIEAYMDTVETVLGTYLFDDVEFDNYYGDVIFDLEETPYDSIIVLNATLSLFQGIEELKNSELRMAVLGRYRSEGTSTYNILNSTYPNYLLAINDIGVNDKNFEGFCDVLDSSMVSYGVLDLEDPFFIDSVDARIYRALSEILAYEEPVATALKSTKISPMSMFNSLSRNTPIDSTIVEAANAVLGFMALQIDQADLIKRTVRKAFLVNQGVLRIPSVTTEFVSNTSSENATLQGFVIEDGGDAVTSRGIAWATFFNPTILDNSKASGTGTGSFTVMLTGLVEGTTYFARSYATNSAGTAYGNCIEFTSYSTVGLEEEIEGDQEMKIYPNPASTLTTFSFQNKSSESRILNIINLNGQIVNHYDLGVLPQGENQVELDLSELQNGLYHCQLLINGSVEGTRKLLIEH